MGTLGCINDMLRRDKENRELRKRNRERIAETRNRLMDAGKKTDYSQMTPKKLEDIRRKTQEKEELDKASSYKLLLYFGIGAIIILFVIWLFMECNETIKIK